MVLTAGEKISIILKRKGMTMADLADKTHQSRQNLSSKMSRDDFSESDLRKMAEVLNCEYRTVFTMKDTGESI